MPDLLWMIVAFIAGAASSEGVRRTANKFSGGVFFGKKKAGG
jgi:hypothetical protein